MRLCHLPLPGLTSYYRAAQIQEAIVQRHFRNRDLLAASKSSGVSVHSSVPSLVPTIITAEFTPVYTFGRSQLHSVSGEQRQYLEDHGRAAVVQTRRGGQVTYHGPGQLVAYPVIDLRYHKVKPRDYVRLLENTVMSVCSRSGVSNVETTEDPGVWIKGGQRKICALGVHIRRGITSHGIGLNVVDCRNSLSWGFSRVVACGLAGKQVTWLSRERSGDSPPVNVSSVASEFVKAFASRLSGIQEIHEASEQDVLKSCRMYECNSASDSNDGE